MIAAVTANITSTTIRCLDIRADSHPYEKDPIMPPAARAVSVRP